MAEFRDHPSSGEQARLEREAARRAAEKALTARSLASVEREEARLAAELRANSFGGMRVGHPAGSALVALALFAGGAWFLSQDGLVNDRLPPEFGYVLVCVGVLQLFLMAVGIRRRVGQRER